MDKLRAYLDAERGRASRLAETLKIFPSAISQWKQIPLKHVLDVERFTGLSRHALRPDYFGPAPRAARSAQRAAA